VAERLAAGDRSLHGLIENGATLAVTAAELADLDPGLAGLRDVDTLEELQAAHGAERAS
jgi:hypothetical protein